MLDVIIGEAQHDSTSLYNTELSGEMLECIFKRRWRFAAPRMPELACAICENVTLLKELRQTVPLHLLPQGQQPGLLLFL